MDQQMPTRFEALDWLRGLMALSILFFHLGAFGYLGGPQDASTTLGRLGIYGVSVFFILSGLSMSIGYDRYLTDMRSRVDFFVRRIFRIWPLLWLSVICVAIPASIAGKGFSLKLIAANITTLFGFIMPHAYINMGAWSIGNEMVYYALTPFFILAYQRSLWIGNAITMATVIIGGLFAFVILTPSQTLEVQWRNYINPFNNMFLYCSGIALYYNFGNIVVYNWSKIPVITITTFLFLMYPATGDQITIVTGVHRVSLSVLSIAVVLAFYKFAPRLPLIMSKPLEQLGIATYGVYLLHPIVVTWLQKGFDAAAIENPGLFVVLVVVGTIALALVIFRYVEAPMIRVGRRLTRSGRTRSGPAEAPI
jgi:peptidoglycan/LPS O-acetylase OafA/YrhL